MCDYTHYFFESSIEPGSFPSPCEVPLPSSRSLVIQITLGPEKSRMASNITKIPNSANFLPAGRPTKTKICYGRHAPDSSS